MRDGGSPHGGSGERTPLPRNEFAAAIVSIDETGSPG
jgi:hypothetical protein